MASPRAGRFIRQPGGFSAFRGALPELLAGASLALGRLDGLASILPNPDLSR